MFTFNKHCTPILAAITLSFSVVIGAIAAPKVDAKTSSVTATFKQMNVPISAKFTRFTANVNYNAAALEKSAASVEIDIASFDLGDPEYNKEVLKKEWFNAAQFGTATFTSTSIKAGANGTLNATGKLAIKGKVVDVSFPVTIKKEGTNQVFEGVLPIKRLTFAIGDGEWKDTSIVADDVIVKFHIVVTP